MDTLYLWDSHVYGTRDPLFMTTHVILLFYNQSKNLEFNYIYYLLFDSILDIIY